MSYKISLILINYCLIIAISLVNTQNENRNENSIDCENLDLINFIPFKEVSLIVSNAVHNDHETQNAVKFLQSNEFKDLLNRVVLTIHNQPLLGFIGGVGLQVADVLDHLVDSLKVQKEFNIENEVDYYNYKQQQNTGVGGVVRKIVNVLPTDKIRHCYNFKLNAKPAFKHVMDQLNTPEFQNAVKILKESEQYQVLSSQLEDRGIEFNNWLGQAMNFFGVQ